MSQNDYIINLLDLKDKNIKIYNKIDEIKIKGRTYKVIYGKLTYTPTSCPKCGCINNNTIIKWAVKTCKVKIPKISNNNTILLLDKQRFLCKCCNHTFTADTSVVEHCKNISNQLNYKVRTDLMKNESGVDIAYDNGISPSSVNRILDDISSKPEQKHISLPNTLNIDELKATSDTQGPYACIITCPSTNNNTKVKNDVFDLLDYRDYDNLYKYFTCYDANERHKVIYITCDFYPGYIKLAKALFRNAHICIDRFHIITQPYNALDSYRASLCKKSNPNHNKLKKYWKLIVKNKNDLTDVKHYSKCFKRKVSQKEIVTYLINTNEELKSMYNLYQGILNALDSKDFDTFKKIIYNTKDQKLTKKMKNAIILFRKNIRYIENSFKYKCSNSVAEGTNNLIKNIKRTAYGYRKFEHLKARLLLIKQGIILRNTIYN